MNTQPDFDNGVPENTPIPARVWAMQQSHAASMLPGDFADRVLRKARLARDDAPAVTWLWRFFHNPFALSALTACACFAAALIFHNQITNQTNEENLADWRDLVAQVDTFDPL